MFKRPGRYVAALVPSVPVLVGAATVICLLLSLRQSIDVAVPAPNATPEQVVAAYHQALSAHDCGTAEAVMTEGGAKDRAKWWCENTRLTDVVVKDHFREHPKDSGRSAPEEVANVPVTFNLKSRRSGNDGTMDDGATTWGYLLVRDSADSPWRIFEQGLG